MATANVKARCVTCGKEKATSKCAGCSQDFCYKHLGDHRQELGKQLDEVEVMRDLFQQTVNEQKLDPKKQSLIQEIDQWEHDSMKKIRQTAEEARQEVYSHITVHFTKIERKLNEFTDQLRRSRDEEDFFESDLHEWSKELNQLTEQLAKPSIVTIHQDQTPLITKICVHVSSNQGKQNATFFPVIRCVNEGYQIVSIFESTIFKTNFVQCRIQL